MAQYSTFAVTSFFSGTINNRLGARLTLSLGAAGYALVSVRPQTAPLRALVRLRWRLTIRLAAAVRRILPLVQHQRQR